MSNFALKILYIFTVYAKVPAPSGAVSKMRERKKKTGEKRKEKKPEKLWPCVRPAVFASFCNVSGWR